MKLNNLIIKNKFDIRTIERNIRSGLITNKEYKQYLDSLQDLTDQQESIIDLSKLEKTKNTTVNNNSSETKTT